MRDNKSFLSLSLRREYDVSSYRRLDPGRKICSRWAQTYLRHAMLTDMQVPLLLMGATVLSRSVRGRSGSFIATEALGFLVVSGAEKCVGGCGG
jgi:hypothetical protein